MIVENGKYYLYRHVRLDNNQPFYIGIGSKQKGNSTVQIYNRAYAKYGRNSIWKRITSKSNYIVEIILESNSKEFIKDKEIEFVKLYGRINIETGILANLTNGGDNREGYIVSDETRKKMSDSGKKRTDLNKSVQSMRDWQIINGNPFLHKRHTAQTKNIIRNKLVGKKLSTSNIEKRRLTLVPIEKRERIVEMVISGCSYNKISKTLKTSRIVILKVKEEYKII